MQTVTEILIDFSSSMNDKLVLIKSALLNDIIPVLNSAKIGIKTFSATRKKEPIIKTILPLSIKNKARIENAINTLPSPYGNSPIAAAIKNSVDNLKTCVEFDKNIILITDGEENCDGNCTNEVWRAGKYKIKIHILGIELTPEATKKVSEILRFPNCSYTPIPFVAGSVYNQDAVQLSLCSFYAAVKQPILQHDSIVPIGNNYIEPVTVPLQKEVKPNIKEATTENKTVKNNTTDDKALKLIIDEITNIKEQLKELAKEKGKIFDIEEDSELNEQIRKASEEFLFEVLKKKHPNRVKWLNKNGESYSDHDFEILNVDGSIEYYIECKGTSKTKPTFYLTKNEWHFFKSHKKLSNLFCEKFI